MTHHWTPAAALLLGLSCLPAQAAPETASCKRGEQTVRVRAYEDRGRSVHVELADPRHGQLLHSLDVAKPGHRYYERHFSRVGRLACLPRDEAASPN